jgi:hypothetical protein
LVHIYGKDLLEGPSTTSATGELGSPRMHNLNNTRLIRYWDNIDPITNNDRGICLAMSAFQPAPDLA